MATPIPPRRQRGIRQSTIDTHIGQKYGLWTVLSYSHTVPINRHHFVCRCDCGTIKPVQIYEAAVGETKSCGCLRHRPSPNRLAHGEAAFNYLVDKYKRHAKTRGVIYTITREHFRQLISQSCFYCGKAPFQECRDKRYDTGSFLYNGIDRVDNDLGYTSDNCVTSCRPCNVAKGSVSKEMVYKLYHRLFS